jgi:hypothetical protein
VEIIFLTLRIHCYREYASRKKTGDMRETEHIRIALPERFAPRDIATRHDFPD